MRGRSFGGAVASRIRRAAYRQMDRDRRRYSRSGPAGPLPWAAVVLLVLLLAVVLAA